MRIVSRSSAVMQRRPRLRSKQVMRDSYRSTCKSRRRIVRVVFMFTGQGAQYVDMARELYDTEASFREDVDHCCEILEPHLNSTCAPCSILPPSAPTSERTVKANSTDPGCAFRHRVCAGPIVDALGRASGGVDWSQYRRIRRCLFGRRLHARRCFKGCRGARATDAAGATGRDARRSAF